jgi:O-acetyl-ADP-ribose deacetylase
MVPIPELAQARTCNHLSMGIAVTDRIELVQGCIAQQRADVIVNAANETLLPKARVSTAIHRYAGHRLTYECAKLGGCLPGQVKITQGFRLNSKWVIHTVGPKWVDGTKGEALTLIECYRNIIAASAELGASTIAIPTIATGALGFPLGLAARIAVETCSGELRRRPEISKLRFVLLTEAQLQMYQSAFDLLFMHRGSGTVGTATVWAPQ